jgi:hypothetical protein
MTLIDWICARLEWVPVALMWGCAFSGWVVGFTDGGPE